MDEAAGAEGAPYAAMAIAWAHTGDGEHPFRAMAGGTELVVRVNDFPAEPLYTLLVDGQPFSDLEDWPASWLRPAIPAPQLRRAAAARLARGRVDVIVAAAWAGILCELPRSGAADAVAALGLTGTLTPAASYRRLEPAPPGIARFQLAEGEGDVSSVHVELENPVTGRADLDALLGPGSDVPRVHYDQPYPVCYRVTAAGAPYTCDLFADFDDAPQDGGPARSLRFRRQPAR
jgi:hypothetical protein